ncbi:MAG: toll/interleukin-1 receptor domain-containing protein [Saprospiraceae bacterium]|nr:toll/interleukin-1 receptor domain-containing protein [Saprospiraceae bacterium]
MRDANGHCIFLDQHIFSNYDFDPVELGQGLCKSICWLVLFSRNYLSGSLWCASELDGMLRLEEKRLQNLGLNRNLDLGFVVPVLLAGDPENLPPSLANRKHHLVDLKKFFLRPSFATDNDFADLLTDMLDKIGRVQEVVLSKKLDICSDCGTFRLSDVGQIDGRMEIENFVKSLVPPQPTT